MEKGVGFRVYGADLLFADGADRLIFDFLIFRVSSSRCVFDSVDGLDLRATAISQRFRQIFSVVESWGYSK